MDVVAKSAIRDWRFPNACPWTGWAQVHALSAPSWNGGCDDEDKGGCLMRQIARNRARVAGRCRLFRKWASHFIAKFGQYRQLLLPFAWVYRANSLRRLFF